jgi:uncharacterized iron-regulated membrane protein
VSDLGWFALFAAIFLLMAAISGWMVWFSRRAMRAHKGQIEDMVREMREVIEEEGQSSTDDDDGPARP